MRAIEGAFRPVSPIFSAIFVFTRIQKKKENHKHKFEINRHFPIDTSDIFVILQEAIPQQKLLKFSLLSERYQNIER